MSYQITDIYDSYNLNGVNMIRAYVECDTFSDLPPLQLDTLLFMAIGSTAHVIATNKVYAMQTGGAWIEQDEASRMDVYTTAQTDALIADARADASAELAAALVNVQTTNITNVITATADSPFSLNDLTQVGSYQYTAASIPYITGIPAGVTNPARVDVIALPAARRQQILRPTGGTPAVYIRNSTGAGFQSWYSVGVTAV